MQKKKMKQIGRYWILLLCLLPVLGWNAEAQSYVYGKITDKESGDILAFAYIAPQESSAGVFSNTEGYYKLALPDGKHKIKATYPSYEPFEIEVFVEKNDSIHVDISLKPNPAILKSVTVSTSRTVSSEEAVINEIKKVQNVASGVSSQQIAKTQDSQASEVVKRIPGVTIMDNRFINIRGLSQRYNNVWLNAGIAPSSESDSRAFSFDFVPSSMIENIVIYKNLSPDLPADFSGGFVKISTTSFPAVDKIAISYGTEFRTNSVFQNHEYYNRAAGDLFGGGSLSRSLPNAFPANLNDMPLDEACKEATQLNNNWKRKSRTAIPDQILSLSFANKYKIKRGGSIGQVAYISYKHQDDRYTLSNNSYGIYDIRNEKSSYSKQYVDTQYIAESKIALGYNLSIMNGKKSKIYFKNLFQNIGKDVVTSREGVNYSNNYIEKSQEFLYRHRLTYAGQLELSQILKRDTNNLHGVIGYSFARNNEPDRRIMDSRMDQNESSPFYGQYKAMDNDIRRYFQTLNDHGVSLGLDYDHKFHFNNFKPSLKTGIYSEFRYRQFDARNFAYKKGMDNNLTIDYYYLPYEEMMDLQYLNPNGFFLTENTGKADSYQSSNAIQSAYLLFNIPFFGVTLNGGLRAEYQHLTLDSYESDGVKEVNIRNNNIDLFPAVNLSYTLKEKHIFRAVYGKTINRPEFREIAPYVYYDFESFSYYEGNPNLQNAHIHNVDVRYEFYPQKKEMVTIGAFYKKFFNPIEVTYFHAGGQLQYTYMNANSAQCYGAEIDIRKSLQFMGLKDFSLVLNASFIQSEVLFPKESIEEKRPLQGQSPYILNAGLYYEHKKLDLSFSILYNVAGKRIVAVGEVNQLENERIPHTYEMPRHSLDASIRKKFGKVSISLSAKNILNQKQTLTQIGSYTIEGESYQYKQDTKVIKTGVQISAGISVEIQ